MSNVIDSELDISIERRIIIGMIVSTDYLKAVQSWWDDDFIVSQVAFTLSNWIWEYYEKYSEAPVKEIQGIYDEKKKTLPDDVAEEIGYDILPSLSEEFKHKDKFNIKYLLDRTVEYFRARHLEIHNEKERELILAGKNDEAERLRALYLPLVSKNNEDYDGFYMGSEESIEMIGRAFSEQEKGLIEFPGPFGDLLNAQLGRDAFVAFLAPEKRGKSFILLEMGYEGPKTKK